MPIISFPIVVITPVVIITSRLGCQAVIRGDVVVEFPLYTRNYVQEGGDIQLGKSDPKPAPLVENAPLGEKVGAQS